MKVSTIGAGVCLAIASVLAQTTTPVVNPRGVINAFTQQPAPTAVAPGGLVWIQGLNLGPVDGLTAPVPWPVKLGDPAIEVLINGRPAPIGYISPGKIIAQVPFETNNGLAQAVVRQGTSTSRPARFFVQGPVYPGVRTVGDKGFGNPIATGDSPMLITATGLGNTDPKLDDGEAGAADAPQQPRAAIQLFIGGLPANVNATAATDRPGEFDVKIDVPAGALAGDPIRLVANARAANTVTYGRATAPEVKYLPMPDGAGEIRTLTSSDVRGLYLLADGPRDDKGCYTSYVFDFGANEVRLADSCLTALRGSPAVPANEGPALAAFVGPPASDTQGEGISATVKIFNPTSAAPMTVTLPAAASSLISGAPGMFTAVIPGTPPTILSINPATGTAEPAQATGGAGGGAGAALAALGNLTLDLGGGITHVLAAPVAIGQGSLVVVVGDDAENPKAAKLALLNSKLAVTGTRDFPDAWVPLVAPAPAAPGNGGGGAGNAGANRVSLRLTTLFDSTSRQYFVLAHKADNSVHGLVVFPADGDGRAVPFPDGWYAAACTSNINIFNLELSRQIVLFGGATPDIAVKNPCPAAGFLITDFAAQAFTAAPLQGQGQMNAASNFGDMNDYIYATNTDPARRGNADTLFVVDGVAGSSTRLDLPPDVAVFSGVTQVPALGLLVALATNKAAGDAGVVIFDLEANQTHLLPVPDGFASVQFLEGTGRSSVFENTRKLVMRGMKPGGAGSQLLVYDLVTGDLSMPANPDGVVYIGGAPQSGAGAAAAPTIIRANQKANTVAAVGLDADKKQVGVLVLRVP